MRAATILVVLITVVVACDRQVQPQSISTSRPQLNTIPDPQPDNRLYERNIVFMTTGTDSLILVPWLFRASTLEKGVERTAEGWLARAGLWELFFTDRWDSPPTRTPFRVHPRDPMNLVIGPGDLLERIVFEEGTRQLEVILGEGMSDWSGSHGETFRVHRGTALFGNLRVEGMVMDMNRVQLRDSPRPGEWMFLTGPERLAIVIESTGVSPNHTAWGRRGDEEFRWPEVNLEWTSLRFSEEAHQDIPVGWRIRSTHGGLQITLRSIGMDLQVGESEGSLFPVNGLFQVAGLLVISGDTLDVRGLVRYVQH